MTGNDNTQTQSSVIPPIQDDSVPFTPFAKSAPSANNITISVSPESAPIDVAAPEKPNDSQEYGYDAIQQIEQKAEQEATVKESAEQKEAKSPISNQTPPQDDKKKDETKEPEAVEPLPASVIELPIFQGHKVSDTVTRDIENIKIQAGKGDPNKSQTAIYLFLDRLLRKQSATGK